MRERAAHTACRAVVQTTAVAECSRATLPSSQWAPCNAVVAASVLQLLCEDVPRGRRPREVILARTNRAQTDSGHDGVQPQFWSARLCRCFQPEPRCRHSAWTCHPSSQLASNISERSPRLVRELSRNFVFRLFQKAMCYARGWRRIWGVLLRLLVLRKRFF